MGSNDPAELEKRHKKAELGLRFQWHLDGMVAGSAKPGRYGDIMGDLEFLRDQGVEVIVNLTSHPIGLPEPFQAHFTEVHEPMPDGHPPDHGQLERIIERVKAETSEGRRVVIHCRGGVGRTATVLIPVLMDLEGLSLEQAIDRLRKAGRYTQSMQQWEFLKEWTSRR